MAHEMIDISIDFPLDSRKARLALHEKWTYTSSLTFWTAFICIYLCLKVVTTDQWENEPIPLLLHFEQFLFIFTYV
jgi:hypothetical protein